MEDAASATDEIEFLWDGYDYITIPEPVSAKKKETAGVAH